MPVLPKFTEVALTTSTGFTTEHVELRPVGAADSGTTFWQPFEGMCNETDVAGWTLYRLEPAIDAGAYAPIDVRTE